jgi:site-specific DNA-methyltransferase (adenine-specific)
MKPYYQHAGITIYLGDCREVLEFLPVAFCRACRCDLGDEGILAIHLAAGHDVEPHSRCVLTDPPYGLGIAAHPFRQKYEVSDWDDEPMDAETTNFLLRFGTEQIIWGGNFFPLPPAQCFLVWDKCQPEEFSSSMCEQAWSSIKSPAKLFRFPVLGYQKFHPTQKPVELMRWCLKFSSQAEVLDPFMGSGTTLIAAKDMGKSAIGIEIEEKYCEIAAKRLSQEVFDFK